MKPAFFVGWWKEKALQRRVADCHGGADPGPLRTIQLEVFDELATRRRMVQAASAVRGRLWPAYIKQSYRPIRVTSISWSARAARRSRWTAQPLGPNGHQLQKAVRKFRLFLCEPHFFRNVLASPPLPR
ncbi:hypothetical protein AJ87_13895 [Rhizobium yanglingense]|nr:hypothetical protein AJ87_13895 [Rhizobium yanglingense]